MRWPGHAALWRQLIALKLLSDDPVKGLPFGLTPHEFMVKHLEPQLQYREGERDIVAMRVIVAGRRGGLRPPRAEGKGGAPEERRLEQIASVHG